jgi:hypothetical protein
MLIGAVISKMNILEWVCAAIALSSSAWLLIRDRKRQPKLRLIELAGLVIATGLLCYYSMVINPRLNDMRATIGDFDHPNASQQYVQQRAEFDAGHKLSSTLVQVNMLILVGCFVLGMVNDRRSGATPTHSS